MDSSIPITVVGNKSDAVSNSETGCVDQLEAQEWAADAGVTLFEVSARNGSKLLDVFYSVGRRLRPNIDSSRADHSTLGVTSSLARHTDPDDRLWSIHNLTNESSRRPLESKRSFDLDVDHYDRQQQQTRKSELRRSNSIERSTSREGQYQDDYLTSKSSADRSRYRSEFEIDRSYDIDQLYLGSSYDNKSKAVNSLSDKKLADDSKLKDIDAFLAEFTGRAKKEEDSVQNESAALDSILDNLDRTKSNRYRSNSQSNHLSSDRHSKGHTSKPLTDPLSELNFDTKESNYASRSWNGKHEPNSDANGRTLINGKHDPDESLESISRSNRLSRRYSERLLHSDFQDRDATKNVEPWQTRVDQLKSGGGIDRSVRRADSLDTKKATTTSGGRLDKSDTGSFSLKELDKLMAKLEQDNKVLAELDRKFSHLQQRGSDQSSGYKSGGVGTTNLHALTSHLNSSLPALANSAPNAINGGRSATAMRSASAAAAAAAAATNECNMQLALAEHVIDKIDIPNRGRCRVYIARYSYDPFKQSPNEHPEAELHLNAGDFIMMTGEVDQDGFFMGELLDGRKGLVPSNFVEKLVGEDLFEFQASVLYGHKADSLLDESASLRMGLMSGSGGPGSLTGSATGNTLFPPEFYDALLSDAMQHTNFQHLLAPGTCACFEIRKKIAKCKRKF